ncbi:PREDICTED: uncharacterized protein LOC109470675 [Branchiostoma belcheri]|uniref:chitinase n=1 Tax=Branchiostoma belcheri TaxID=7741 RepID=A0A6P4YLG9_BRABE|nr:PREDICTED: uncharacterized protein LOC109470675 [Branchiostoma belcheri]
MLGLLLVLSTLLYLRPESADAVSITNVTVPDRGGCVIQHARPDDPTWENRVEFKCEYTITPAPATPPTITWLSGAFADPDRVVIYRLSSSGEVYVHPSFAGHASIESRTSPTLILTDYMGSGRFWCRVTNEEQPDEFGTDEESLLFWYLRDLFEAPKRLSFVNLDKTPVRVGAGETARLVCEGTYYHGSSIKWLKGPSCSQDGRCDVYETVVNKTYTWVLDPDPGTLIVSPKYEGRASLDRDYAGVYTPTLIITDIRPSDAGRYWCAPDHALHYTDLGNLNRDAQSVVVIYDDDQPSCDGKPDGMYQDPSDCSRYYTCSAGVLHGPTPCLSGLVFNQALQVCDWPYNVACV